MAHDRHSRCPARTEPGAKRGRRDHRRPFAYHRRSRQRQNPGHHPPHRLPGPGLPGQPPPDHGGHLHQQGRPGNAEPNGPPGRSPQREPDRGHIPFLLRQDAAHGWRLPGTAHQLHYLRRRRPAFHHQASHGAGGAGPQTQPSPGRAKRHLQSQKRASGLASGVQIRLQLLRGGLRPGLPPL